MHHVTGTGGWGHDIRHLLWGQVLAGPGRCAEAPCVGRPLQLKVHERAKPSFAHQASTGLVPMTSSCLPTTMFFFQFLILTAHFFVQLVMAIPAQVPLQVQATS